MTKEFDKEDNNSGNQNHKMSFKISRKDNSKPTKKVIFEDSILDIIKPQNSNKIHLEKKIENNINLSSFFNSSIFKKFSFEETNYQNFSKEDLFGMPTIQNNVEQNLENVIPVLENKDIQTAENASSNSAIQTPTIDKNLLNKEQSKTSDVFANVVLPAQNNNVQNNIVLQNNDFTKLIEKLSKSVSDLSNRIYNLEKKLTTQEEIKEEISTICDNKTLLIDEQTQKVYLPYTLDDIFQDMENYPDFYSLEEIVEDKYTLPLYIFKNPARSRFKETYKLMRVKEKTSISEALTLAGKLMFNSSLYPAIITACKNLGELNLYLDCLYKNNLENFEPFKVVFRFLPTIVK